MNKRYYWLQLKESFFRQREMKKLAKHPKGHVISIIYLKLLLHSLYSNGIIYYEETESNVIEQLVLEIDETFENVKDAIDYLSSNKLIKTSESKIEMIRFGELTGSIADSTIRSQKSRFENNNNVKAIESPYIAINQVDATVCNIDIDRESDFDSNNLKVSDIHRGKDYKSTNTGKSHIDHSQVINAESVKQEMDESIVIIIDYLNSVLGTSFKYTTRETQELIKARLNEGFTLEDFKEVIDIKYSDWKNNDNMVKFLRPETLFSLKFESYLNQPKNLQQRKEEQFKELFRQRGFDVKEA